MEVTSTHMQIAVTEGSQPSAARYAAQHAAETAGLSPEDVYRAGIVATELGTNLVKHATRGEILVRMSARAPEGEVEILAVDCGPGVGDLGRAMADGHSTSGTSGNGLGAVQRMADDFDIYSQAGKGTIVMARMRAGRAPRRRATPLAVGGVSVSKAGEQVCGDAWEVHHHPDGALIVVTDGLGHGLQAAQASSAALATITPDISTDCVRCLQAMHEGTRHTRGAAASVADLRPAQRLMKFAGIGNVAGSVCGIQTQRHAVPLNGTLGHQARQFREYSYPWEHESLLVMHSDGLGSHWSLDVYPGLRQRHPSVVAAVLYRDFNRQRDDVTVVVAREAAA
jgi:anti-sigma regulatory factor (Ser/Thr protein kinase)